MVETAGVLVLSFFPTRGLAAKVIPLDIEMFQPGGCGDTFYVIILRFFALLGCCSLLTVVRISPKAVFILG